MFSACIFFVCGIASVFIVVSGTLDRIDESAERITHMEQAKEAAYAALIAAGAQLTAQRAAVGEAFEKDIVTRLVELGMPNTRFAVAITPRRQPDATGVDSVAFLFSANKNAALQNIAEVASGGEISRIMLSLKSIIAAAKALPTLIFDEIDTGVSGAIAARMADIMADIARHGRQVISITHLPQIAAKGAAHYKVYKEDTPPMSFPSQYILLTQPIPILPSVCSDSALAKATAERGESSPA